MGERVPKIEKGQIYVTRNSDDLYGKSKMTVTKVENPKSRDGYVTFRLEPKAGKKRSLRSRVWWVMDFCNRMD